MFICRTSEILGLFQVCRESHSQTLVFELKVGHHASGRSQRSSDCRLFELTTEPGHRFSAQSVACTHKPVRQRGDQTRVGLFKSGSDRRQGGGHIFEKGL